MTAPAAPDPNAIDMPSVFDSRRRVTHNPYAENPLESDMAGSPAYPFAKASGIPAPKLFQGGRADLPAFTASGLDPKLLLQLPYTARHAAAAEPDITVVHAMFEQYAHDPHATYPHEGLDEAKRRMTHWASTAGVAQIEAKAKRDDMIAAHANALKGIPENLRQAVFDRAYGGN